MEMKDIKLHPFELSKKDVLTTVKNYEKIMERVEEIADNIGFLTSEFNTLETEKTEFDKDNVYITAYDSHYDLYDSVSGSFPLDFLFEDDAKHKNWYRGKMEEQEKQHELEHQKAEKERKLQELQRLKEKYPESKIFN